MKNLISVILVINISFFFASCNDKTDDIPSPNIEENALYGKWEVSDPGSFYRSFEFNRSGDYIIVTEEFFDNIKFGKFQMIDDQHIELTGFGSISISSSDAAKMDFKLEENENPVAGTTIELFTTKVPSVSDSERTSMLAQTWRMDKFNGIDVSTTEFDIITAFTSSGTFMSTLVDEGEFFAEEYGYWKWQDPNEQSACFSYDLASDPLCKDPETALHFIEVTDTYIKYEQEGDIIELVLVKDLLAGKSKK